MNRLAVLGFVLLLGACGGSAGSGNQQTSAQTVASSSGDFTGLQKCAESGSWDHYLAAEQSKDPGQYATDKQNFDAAKSAGANDTYVAVYAADPSACGTFSSATPTGKEAQVYAIRFKDSAAASANFKSQLSQFNLSDADIENVKSAGGTVKQGSQTGLGDNSTVIEVTLGPVSVYAAAWQNKQFEVALLAIDIPVTDGESAATKINGRIK